ncbi:MAG TPA: M4 family metallopeptidase [Thermoanaerobaculia bacterium]|jgi:Zn-dependent metalloprotease|nr:M4 family metallopeptidase [Thermoanaerobaculia bacterium]
MSCCPNPIHCILPPYVLDHMSQLGDEDKKVRDLAVDAIARSATLRATRTALGPVATIAGIAAPDPRKTRLIYDSKNLGSSFLPGKLVRREGDPKSKDPAVNEAYDHSGTTHDFYKKVHNRNSLDDRGMTLVSSVHVGSGYNNAFWNGRQMAYGDGDGAIFIRFTKSLDVVGHELTHGVVTHTCNLEYLNESGALNEHFADVFGSLVKQWNKKQTAAKADWLIGPDIMGPATTAKSLRTFKDEKAYVNDHYLGTDPQPKHLKDKYKGTSDSGGVHINSGIPNHAFYLLARALGGNAWDKPGKIWYNALKALSPTSNFLDMVAKTTQAAAELYGSTEEKAVAKAWKDVGFP